MNKLEAFTESFAEFLVQVGRAEHGQQSAQRTAEKQANQLCKLLRSYRRDSIWNRIIHRLSAFRA